mmetsp:Transcript_22819/g.33816  ORF Transcript_22819/g.33816 Transcript_22819/m.33816 type:complete len:89 (+) Transcript_22819:196-462(+)
MQTQISGPKINPQFAIMYAELEINSQQEIQQGANTKRKKHDAERKMTRRCAIVGDSMLNKSHHLPPANSGDSENNGKPEQSVKRRRSA